MEKEEYPNEELEETLESLRGVRIIIIDEISDNNPLFPFEKGLT